jgi:hypothetical protein
MGVLGSFEDIEGTSQRSDRRDPTEVGRRDPTEVGQKVEMSRNPR